MSHPLTALLLPALLGLGQAPNPQAPNPQAPASTSPTPTASGSPDPVSGATSTVGAAQVPGGSQAPASPGTRPGDQNRGTLPGTGTPATNPSTTGTGVDTAVTTKATPTASAAPMPSWDETRCPVDGKTVRRWRGFKANLNGRDYYTDSRRCAELLQGSPETYLESNGVPRNATDVKIPSGSDTAPSPAPNPAPNPTPNSTTPASPQPDGAGGSTVPPSPQE